MSDAQTAAADGEVHAGAQARSGVSRTGAGADSSAYTTIGPDGVREMRPRGADVLNDDTMDDTVDADGKNIQAQHYEQMMRDEPDAVITSNATTVNYVNTPSDGLGGFDSRPGRNGVLLMLARGWRDRSWHGRPGAAGNRGQTMLRRPRRAWTCTAWAQALCDQSSAAVAAVRTRAILSSERARSVTHLYVSH
ncbi:hypothetical protein BRCH_00958c [Candidatus Burkholderia brachyanthoides]|nr:hypothetical protein BRCH_00958c [Candidatus Burkholderia brachyanthoides]